MTRHGIGLALALLALPAAADPQAEAGRFVMETHAVILPGLEQPQPVTFMLNTINGDTWRVTDEGLKAVFPAPPVDEPDGWSRRPQRFNEETEALLEPLRGIRIPELDFRQTDIRDVMDSLFQHQAIHEEDQSFERLPERDFAPD